MIGKVSPQDFLLYLRTRCPPLARRLDGILGLELRGSSLAVRVPEGSWWEAELAARRDLLRCLARACFRTPVEVTLEPRPGDPAALPFPVSSTKVWNHVAFWVRQGEESAVAAVRKPRYTERWGALTDAPDDRLAEELAAPEVFSHRYRPSADVPPGETASTWLLPDVVGDLCGLAREASSYAQLVLAFPGDEEADRLEARLCAVKEWGTPEVPAPILQKYVGRLHYLAPGVRSIGIRAAEVVLAGGAG